MQSEVIVVALSMRDNSPSSRIGADLDTSPAANIQQSYFLPHNTVRCWPSLRLCVICSADVHCSTSQKQQRQECDGSKRCSWLLESRHSLETSQLFQSFPMLLPLRTRTEHNAHAPILTLLCLSMNKYFPWFCWNKNCE